MDWQIHHTGSSRIRGAVIGEQLADLNNISQEKLCELAYLHLRICVQHRVLRPCVLDTTRQQGKGINCHVYVCSGLVCAVLRGETVSNTATSQGARAGGYFRHIRGDLVRNTGTGCEGQGGGTDAGCVASSSFTDGGTDEATGQPKRTVFQNTFLIDGYFAEACEDE